MAFETMTKLARVDVGSGGQATIDFTNIPQGYTDLILEANVRPSSLDDMYIKFNGDSSLFSARRLTGNGASSSTDTSTYFLTPQVATASSFSSFKLTIPNYSGSRYKSFTAEGVSENSATTAYMSNASGLWSSIAPITSVTLYLSSATFVQNSSATLYGIKAARTAVGNSVKGFGGAISFDGTYVYHSINTTGTFTPSQSITADVLVVGGGGGGGLGGPQGSGGGGGRVTLYNNIILTASSPYLATIAAGGTGAIISGAGGTAGGTSSFMSYSAAGGGYGGSDYYSGRGGDTGNNINGTVTNYIGGTPPVSTDNSHLAGGGGAGAGSNGMIASMNSGVVGSIGGSGYGFFYNGITCYFGGGGNGGNEGTGTNGGWGAYAGYIPTYRAPGGGGWGGGQYPTSNPAAAPTAGEPNSGGGGGGGTWDNSLPIVSGAGSGANGGSGVVIIRYKA